MMICKDCSTQNTADSKFCKVCGRELESKAPTATIKPEEIDGLLAEGYKLLHAGQATEATYLADAVVKVDPDNTSALALKAMCHEGTGELTAAVDLYEQIVVLNPGSTIDLIKLTQLRKRLDLKPSPAELEFKSRNVVAMLSAVAAVALVITLGVSLALNNRAQPAEPAANSTLAQQDPQQPTGFEISEAKKDAANPAPPPAQSNAQPMRPPIGGGSQIPTWDPTRGTVITTSGNQLPNPGAGDTVGGPGPNGPEPPPKNDDPTEPTKPPRPRGTIDISESRGEDSGATSENAYRVGVEKMRAGDYRGALSAFQTSLSSSKNPGLTHQFIARCYKNLGDTGNAKSHFLTAAQIYERNGALNDAKACRRELELLGG